MQWTPTTFAMNSPIKKTMETTHAVVAKRPTHRLALRQPVGPSNPIISGAKTKQPINNAGCSRKRNAEIPGEYSSEIDAVAEWT
jgi:hypothetical protein